jgi:hypothetical protein
MKDIRMSNTDWGEVAMTAAVFLLIILTVGEPDLLDAIMYHLTDGKMGLE